MIATPANTVYRSETLDTGDPRIPHVDLDMTFLEIANRFALVGLKPVLIIEAIKE